MSDKYQLIWVKEAISDLEECREFLKSKNPKAAKNATKRIIEVTKLLLEQPYLGHPIDDMPEFQKISIPCPINIKISSFTKWRRKSNILI